MRERWAKFKIKQTAAFLLHPSEVWHYTEESRVWHEKRAAFAMDALIDNPHPFVDEHMMELLDHGSNNAVSMHAAQVLGRRKTKEAVPALLNHARFVSREVRESAIRALAEIHDARAIPTLMRSALDAPDVVENTLDELNWQARVAAVHALATFLPNPKAIDALAHVAVARPPGGDEHVWRAAQLQLTHYPKHPSVQAAVFLAERLPHALDGNFTLDTSAVHALLVQSKTAEGRRRLSNAKTLQLVVRQLQNAYNAQRVK